MSDDTKLKPPWEITLREARARLEKHLSVNPVVRAVYDCCRHSGAEINEGEFSDIPGMLSWMVDELVDQVDHIERRYSDLLRVTALPMRFDLEGKHVPTLHGSCDHSSGNIHPGRKVPDDKD